MRIDWYGKDPHGKAFQDSFLYLMKHTYRNEFAPASEHEDLFEGTDFFISSSIRNIRVDVTLRPIKAKTKYLKSFVIPGCTIHVMARYGNRFKDFDEPVCLLYFESFIGKDPYDLVDLIEEECPKEFFDQIFTIYHEHVLTHVRG